MIRKLGYILALSVFLLAGTGWADEDSYGTAADAHALLEKAVTALQQDQAKALEMFTKGEGGFKDRDLYPYCGGPDGNFTAHPTLVGKSLKNLMDTADQPFGEEIYKVAQEGKISQVTYLWPRPGETEPVRKLVFVTKVGDQVCGVGYYARAFF